MPLKDLHNKGATLTVKYKLYIIATVVALLVAIPVTLALDKQHNLLKIERSQNHELQLKIEREQKAKTQTEQKLQEEQKTKEQLKQENEKLKADLQAKLKRQEQERIARAQQVTKPAVSVSRAGGGNCDAYQGLVAQYDWDVSTMMRIMRAESGCNPTNHNYADNHRSCLGSYGLFQIGCVHGLSVAYLSEPANNIASAYKIYKSQGYTAWTTY